MEFTYLTQGPKRYTFEMPRVKEWVDERCIGRTLNLFAGRTLMEADEVRVDIDEDAPADFHVDAYEFVKTYSDQLFRTVILDPPYNVRKAREKYNGRHIGKLTQIKNCLNNIVTSDARVISLGYDSVGMSKHRGYKKTAICLVCHGGDHNDTICLVEDRSSHQLAHFDEKLKQLTGGE